LGSDQGQTSNLREEIYDRYTGALYGDEKEGQSAVTSRDIQETIEWTMPPLLRHFTQEKPAVEFEAENGEDEASAEQETLAVSQVFWKDNQGFTILYLIIKTILMNPNGYVKVYRDEGERVVYENYRNLDLAEISMVLDDENLEIVEQEESKVRPDPDQPNDTGERYDVKIKRTLTQGRNVVTVLPEEEVAIDNQWTHLDLDDCPFVCHYPEKTHSELRGMGIDEEFLDEAYGPGEVDSSERTNREHGTDSSQLDDESQRALRKYTYYECSMLLDYDDDGIAERRRVVLINDEIWTNEEDDEQSIISGSTILMPHKHIGISMAELLLDLQEIKTVVWRQLLDNMYRANNPRTIALKGANIADIMANRRNGILRAKSPGDITMEQTAPVIGQVIPLLGLIDETKEMRSGITKTSTVPSPDLLQNSAEGSYLALVEKADQRIDLLARLLAETVVKRIFIKLHGLIQRNGDTKDMKLNGQWVRVDPTSWRRRESMTVKVGLGHSTKGQQLAAATMIKADHDMLIQQGAVGKEPRPPRPPNPMTGDPGDKGDPGTRGMITQRHIYNGRKLLVEALGEKNVDEYYWNPDMQPQPPSTPPPPDPNMLMIQSNERIEQGKQQVAKGNTQVKVMELRQRQQMDMIKAQSQAAIEERDFRFQQMEARYQKQIDQIEAQLKSTALDDKEEIEKLKIELGATKTQLEDAQHAEQMELDRYKADLSASTSVLVEQMKQGLEVAQGPALQGVSEATARIGQNQESINAALAQISGVISEMRSPKEIAYDEVGEIVGVKNPLTGEIRPLRRGPNGEPIGLE
jgi:hypothetical protein